MLRQLKLQRFGRFMEDSWEFGPGLNVVRGPNEAGKSTIREAIVRLLLADRKVDTGDRSFLSMRSWGATERFVIEGTLQTRDGDFCLLRDYEQGRVELRCHSTEQVLRDEALIAERLSELLGVHSRGVYETTACLAQQEFAQLDAGREVSELLQQTVTGPGTESGAQKVIDALDSEVSSLRRGIDRHARNPGPVRADRDRIAEIEGQIADLRPIVARAEEARDRIDRLSERLSEIDAELGQANRLRERAEERRQVEGKLAGVRERCNELEQRERQAGRLCEDIEGLQGRINALPEITEEQVDDLRELQRECDQTRDRAPELREEAKRRAEEAEEAQKRVAEIEGELPDSDTLQRARDLQREIESLRGTLAAADQDAASAADDLQAARHAHARRRTWLVFAAVLVLGGLLTGLIPIAVVGIVIAVIAALRGPAMAVPVAEQRREQTGQKVEEIGSNIASREGQLDALLREADAADVETLVGDARDAMEQIETAREERTRAATRAQTALDEAEKSEQKAEIAAARLKGRLEQLQAESVEQFLTTASEVFESRRRLSEAQSKLRGVLGDRTLPEIREELFDLSSQRRGLEQELEAEELAYAELTPERFDELVTRIDVLSSERERSNVEIDEHRGAAAHPDADPERLRRLEEQLEVTRERLERHEERLAATELARDLLRQAHSETLSAAIDVLEPRTSELLSVLTSGRYAQVEFDRTSLAPSVYSEEKGESVDPDSELSCATREQVYLAARLALTDLLWPDGPPPIMLDDPFVNFDAARREQALEILRRVAANCQVILFTCHDHYDAIGDCVIELSCP